MSNAGFGVAVVFEFDVGFAGPVFFDFVATLATCVAVVVASTKSAPCAAPTGVALRFLTDSDVTPQSSGSSRFTRRGTTINLST